MPTLFLLVISLSLIPFGTPAESQLAGRGKAFDARFRPLLPHLKGRVGVSIRLPQTVQPFQTAGRTRLYLSVGRAERDAYEIRIESERDCDGANYCFAGSISGQQRTDENKGFIEAIINEGKVVRLANGAKGHYFKGPCGASCVPDSLLWQQEGFYYIVTAAGLGTRQMVQVANSMIVGSPINL